MGRIHFWASWSGHPCPRLGNIQIEYNELYFGLTWRKCLETLLETTGIQMLFCFARLLTRNEWSESWTFTEPSAVTASSQFSWDQFKCYIGSVGLQRIPHQMACGNWKWDLLKSHNVLCDIFMYLFGARLYKYHKGTHLRTEGENVLSV